MEALGKANRTKEAIEMNSPDRMETKMLDKTHVRGRLLLVGGVRKSGTSSLFHAIAAHPQVDTTWMKEPQFLALHPKVVRENLGWYEELFDDHDPDHVMLDGSTWCFTSPWTAEVLQKYFEAPRVIILIRDPAKRAYSGYLHMHKQVPCADRRSFDEILNSIECGVNSNSLSAVEDEVLQEAILNGEVDETYRNQDFHRERADAPFDTRLHDMLYEFKYFQESLYSNHLSRFEEVLGRRLKVIVLEELIAHPKQVLQDVLEFAGLPIDKVRLELRHENQTLVPRNRISRLMMEARERIPVLDDAAQLLKSVGLHRLGRAFRRRLLKRPKPRMNKDQYERARKLLKSEYEVWSERRPSTWEYWQFER